MTVLFYLDTPDASDKRYEDRVRKKMGMSCCVVLFFSSVLFGDMKEISSEITIELRKDDDNFVQACFV